MISTQDARIESLESMDVAGYMEYNGEYYLPLSEKDLEYISTPKNVIPSTRSTLARNSIDIDIKGPISFEKDPTPHIEGKFQGRSFYVPVELSEGDPIFRILFYREGDKLSKSQVEKRSDEILDRDYEIDEAGVLKIPIEREYYLDLKEGGEISLKDLENDKNRLIKPKGQSDRGEIITGEIGLFGTSPISMPDDLYGIIRDSTLQGHTYHINSRAIDPGYQGEVIAEIRYPKGLQPEDPPGEFDDTIYLEVELYKATEEVLPENSEKEVLDSGIAPTGI